MSIAEAGGGSQRVGTGNTSGSATIDIVMPGNVTSGSLLTVFGHRYNVSTDSPFASGDLTKTAGTATIDTPVLNRSTTILDGSQYQQGIWSCLVTGTGSLTLRIGGGVAGAFWFAAADEFTGSWDASRAEAGNSHTDATNSVTPALSGTASSAGAGLFIGGLGIDGSSTITITEQAAFTLIAEEQSASTKLTGSMILQNASGATTDEAEWAISGTWTMITALLQIYKEAGAGDTLMAQVWM